MSKRKENPSNNDNEVSNEEPPKKKMKRSGTMNETILEAERFLDNTDDLDLLESSSTGYGIVTRSRSRSRSPRRPKNRNEEILMEAKGFLGDDKKLLKKKGRQTRSTSRGRRKSPARRKSPSKKRTKSKSPATRKGRSKSPKKTSKNNKNNNLNDDIITNIDNNNDNNNNIAKNGKETEIDGGELSNVLEYYSNKTALNQGNIVLTEENGTKSIVWTLSNFSNTLERVYSPEFKLDGITDESKDIKWNLLFFKKGNKRCGREGNMSVYLNVKNWAKLEKGEICTVNIFFTIVNQTNRANSLIRYRIKNHLYEKKPGATRDWGFGAFHPISSLNNDGIIVDDKIIIQADISSS
eukprot:TRINITY_DN654_c0_g1_i1.p1 TRINITY_DN654_c0_g1~~TRINITY_DN654_c0_g1_i1.p1  ORF type:complete len:352 (-),score=123.12 TRINITY_DN654_c0_g1_i1:121-1176(-)